MSIEPWSITSTKRKAKSATPAPRKRQRFNDVGNTRRKSQQTLTQAQWVTSMPTSFNEDDMQFQEFKRLRSAPNGRTALQRQDSTLTQMDFFSFEERDNAGFDDTLLPTTEPQLPHPTISQLDGTYGSPRKPRKRKASPAASHRSTKRKNTPTNQESQEYKPSKKKARANGADNGVLDSGRRTSSRLAFKARIFSDPDQNLEYFEEALGVSPVAASKPPTYGNVPALEIKDSVEDAEEENVEPIRAALDRPQLETPKRARTIILSSQSPESLPPSTHRANRKSKTTPAPQRTPLGPRSLNRLLEPALKRSTGKSRLTVKRSPIKSKVVVLKLPRRSQQKRVARIEDSEANLWSIPSSSPQLHRPVGEPPIQAPASAGKTSNVAEIPASSQAQKFQSSPPVPSQDSLPDLAALVGSKPLVTKADVKREASNDCPNIPQNEESSVLVRDFAHVPAPTLDVETESTDEAKADNPVPNVSAEEDHAVAHEMEVDSEEVDFDSPIANDTQFNNYVQQRVSSPCPQTTRTPLKNDHESFTPAALTPSSSTPRAKPAAQQKREPVIQSSSDDEPPQTPLPLPRLVESPSARNQYDVVELDSEDDRITLPRPPLIHRSSTHNSTTKVPLNDIPYQSSSSSVSATKAITQKSMHPASMPHPSQMSTQEATQGLLNMSSYPQPRMEAELQAGEDRITIKDSSSYRVPISQLPQYIGGQSHPDMNEVSDSEEEEGDLDLDPPSTSSKPGLATFDERELTPPVERGANDHVAEDYQLQLVSSARGASQSGNADLPHTPVPSSQAISIPSSPTPLPLQRHYSPIPGFDNDTQANFTQNGHVTAAYVHRQREAGIIPTWYVPQPYQVPGYTRRK